MKLKNIILLNFILSFIILINSKPTCEVSYGSKTIGSWDANCINCASCAECTPEASTYHGFNSRLVDVKCNDRSTAQNATCIANCKSSGNSFGWCATESVCTNTKKVVDYLNLGKDCYKTCLSDADITKNHTGQCKWICNNCLDQCVASGNSYDWCKTNSICKDSEFANVQKYIEADDKCLENCKTDKNAKMDTKYPGQCKWLCRS